MATTRVAAHHHWEAALTEQKRGWAGTRQGEAQVKLQKGGWSQVEWRSQQPSQTSPGVFRCSGSPFSFKPQWLGGTAGLQVPEGDHFQAGHFPAYGDLGRNRMWLQALLGTGAVTSRLSTSSTEKQLGATVTSTTRA